ncbi:response regulator [Parvularcula oceani]|uniref:response regulator n=1 Tax=Parvularcula oceani TaxID=1247963 RepID=UPI0004E26960|nr:response regulator [Parvularcula oceani]
MRKTVLAIDDSRTMRDMLRVALTAEGFDVQLAEDGIDGLEKLRHVQPAVVITDINMPRLDGFGVIDGVRSDERFRRTPVLVLTTESAAELKQRAKAAGATGWIVKPFERTKLVSVLNRLVA